jgi:hypothetical protein
MDLHYIEQAEYMDDGCSQNRTADVEHVRQWAAERGFALVPVEPTDRQIFEVCRESGYGDLKTQDPECWEILKRDYRVAVAAAQEPTA